MRRHLFPVVGALALLAGLPLAQQANPPKAEVPVIGDNAGNMSVTGFSSWRTKKLENGQWKITVRTGQGKRIVGKWVKQKMNVEVGELDAIVDVQKDGAKMLVSASMAGQIVANFARKSTNASSTEPQTVDVRAASAEFTAARNEVEVKGGLTLTRTDPGARESMTATGSSGVITLSELGATSNAVKTAVLNGPVVMKMNGQRKGDDGKPQAYVLTGSADKMVFNDAAHTVVFTGNVKITGDDPGLGGEISGVHTATITFAKTGEIESIDLEGDPGRTVIADKKKGGGKR